MPPMATILYFQPATKTFAPEKLGGVRDIIEKRHHRVQVIEEKPTPALVNELWEFWNPIGAIIDCGGVYNDIDAGVFGSRPVVFIGHNPDTLPKSCLLVSNDQRETARAAARELLSTGYSNFAFVHTVEHKKWSDQRERGFAEALSINGRRCSAFRPSEASESDIAWMKRLRRFLAEVKKPCAVFAANDTTAECVLAAAALEGLESPGDIAIVGVDNYKPICEHTSPPLTSIEPDFKRGGRLAATMLLGLAMCNGRWRGNRQQTFGPLQVVRRASTRMLSVPDKAVSDALDLIRREACNGLQAARVARIFPCSRRQADNRFRHATGRSILEEIHAVQLDRAKQLLRDTSVQLKAISDFCGFKNANSLRKFFLRETGTTMSRWRDIARPRTARQGMADMSTSRSKPGM